MNGDIGHRGDSSPTDSGVDTREWEENQRGLYFCRLDFCRSLGSGLRSSPKRGGARAHFPKQRLVIEPSTFADL